MQETLKIILTILATGLVSISSVLITNRQQDKRERRKETIEKEREVRESRRNDRQLMVKPLRDALGSTYQRFYRPSRFIVKLVENAKTQGTTLDDRTLKTLEDLKAIENRRQPRDLMSVFADLLPLTAVITNPEVVSEIEKVFLMCSVPQDSLDSLGLSDDEIKKMVISAYKKLEDYIALGD
jgi:hypothetical protein